MTSLSEPPEPATAGAAHTATVPWQGTSLQTAGVAQGTYFFRVRAENPRGVGNASIERVLTVAY